MKSRVLTVAEMLRQRVEAGLHLGTLAPGARLASIRALSAELHASPRLVLAAYRRLAAEGLVQLRNRSGVFVPVPSPPGDDRLPPVASWLVDVFMRGLSQGIAPTDLRGQARACLDTVRVRAACLECNNDQLYALRRQLHDDYGFDTVAVELGARESPGHSATDADLIVTTQFHRPEARRLARRLRRPVIVVTLDTTFDGEVRRMLAQGEVWWICTDPRFAAKLPHLFAGASVHPLVLDRDPLETVPRDAMVYATRAAAKRLPPGWRAGEVRTVPRVFSAETARALLTFKLRRKLDAAGALTQPSRRRNSGNR